MADYATPSDTDREAAVRRLTLDIVSDSICPWCYIGKRHLEAALPQLAADGLAFEVHWRPFQLNPDMPAGGVDRRTYRTAKFGSWERSQALDAQVAAAGEAAGLRFRHALMARTPNTVASHILIRLAHQAGGAACQDRVVEALFDAYFTGGRDIGDADVLADIAAAAGLERRRALAAIADPADARSVLEEEKLARGLRLNGVPSFVLEGHFLFSGAQPVRTMVDALRQAGAALTAMGALQTA